MTFIALIGFILLVVGPIVIALLFGGRLFDRMDRNRAAQQRRRRNLTTRALPIQSRSIDALLQTEISRDELDDRVARALESFRTLSRSEPVPVEVSEGALRDVEQTILRRESRFVTYFDLAQVQSEMIELLDREVSLLRDWAEIRIDLGAPRPSVGDPSYRAPAKDSTPTDRLRDSIERAVRRRDDADRQMRGLGSVGGAVDLKIGDEDSGPHSGRNRR